MIEYISKAEQVILKYWSQQGKSNNHDMNMIINIVTVKINIM